MSAFETEEPVTVAPAGSDATGVGAASQALTPKAVAAVVGINVLWSGAAVAAKFGLAAFSPGGLTALRLLPAAGFLWLLVGLRGKRVALQWADGPAFLYLGLGLALTYTIFYTGMRQSTASDASLLFACEPLLIALFATVFLRERLSGLQWLGLLLGLAGVGLIVGQKLGNLLMVFALCIETSTGIIGKRLVRRYSGLTIIATQQSIAFVLLLPVLVWELGQRPPMLNGPALGGLLYLSLVCSVVCYGIWYALMERYPISVLGAFILVQPLVGPLYGWLLRGEVLSWRSAAGGALVIGGIALTSLWQPKTRWA